MGAVMVYGTNEIEDRISMLHKNGIGDFYIQYADDEQTIIVRAYDEHLKIEFENTAVTDEIKDAYWEGRTLSLADAGWRE